MPTPSGVLVATAGAVPAEVGHDRAALEAAGFAGKAGQALVLPRAGGPPLVVVGVGEPGTLDADGLRNAAGTFARAAGLAGSPRPPAAVARGDQPTAGGPGRHRGRAPGRLPLRRPADGGRRRRARGADPRRRRRPAADLEAGASARAGARRRLRAVAATWPTARRPTSRRRPWPRWPSASAPASGLGGRGVRRAGAVASSAAAGCSA